MPASALSATTDLPTGADAAACLRDAQLAQREGDFLRALQRAKEAMDLAQAQHQTSLAGEAAGLAALMHGRMREYESAVRLGRLALTWLDDPAVSAVRVETMTALALGCTSLGLMQEGLQYASEALAGAERLDDQRLMCWALNRLACHYAAMSDFPLALQAFERALPLALALDSHEVTFGLLHNQANTHLLWAGGLKDDGHPDQARAQYLAAVQRYREAAQAARDGAMGAQQVMALVNMVGSLVELGEVTAAMQTVEECEALLQSLNAGWLYLDLGNARAEVLLAQGQVTEALAALQHGVEASAATERAAQHPNYLDLAHRCFKQAGNFEAALQHHESMMKMVLRQVRERSDAQIRLLSERLALEQAQREADRSRQDLARQEQISIDLLHQRQALELKAATLHQQAHRDPLTGLANRRLVDVTLPGLLALHPDETASGLYTPLCLVMLDVDHFKRINDLHGHAVGDRVLKTLADVLREGVRDDDVLARWGGEEFLLLSAKSGADNIAAMCERLRQAVQAQDWSGHAAGLAVTVSAGYALAEAGEDAPSLLARADAALYAAKAAGRNRVGAAPPGR